MNSALANHTGATVTKFIGNYRIVEDTINFTDAPKGEKGPTGLTTTSTLLQEHSQEQELRTELKILMQTTMCLTVLRISSLVYRLHSY